MVNVDKTLYDSFTAAYNIYRRKLTANRIPLYASTLPELAMDYGRGVSAKYEVSLDTAVRWMINSKRYFLHGGLASIGKSWDPVQLDMCDSSLLGCCMCGCDICLAIAAVLHKAAATVFQYGTVYVNNSGCATYACHTAAQSVACVQLREFAGASGAMSLDDVQRVLYGKDLGLTLPARDPWSSLSVEHIKRHDISWLDELFTSSAPVSVLERLAAMAGYARSGSASAPSQAHAARATHARSLRVHAPDQPVLCQSGSEHSGCGSIASQELADWKVSEACGSQDHWGPRTDGSDSEADNDDEDEVSEGLLRGGAGVCLWFKQLSCCLNVENDACRMLTLIAT